jgi:hypothetical protein
MMEEDFYYSKENAVFFIKRIIRKAVFFILITLSVALFLYITINAYYFANKKKEEDIKLIKSPSIAIKVKVKKDVKKVANIDKIIYKNIVGNDDEDLARENTKIVKNTKPPKNDKIEINKASNIKIKKAPKIIDLSQEKKVKNHKIMFGTRVQVAAMGSWDAANKYWLYISQKTPNLVRYYDKYITEIDLGKRGIFYRLQIGKFKTQNKAEKFCEEFIMKYNKEESDCIILD